MAVWTVLSLRYTFLSMLCLIVYAQLVYKDITKVDNPIMIAGVFIHRRQTSDVFNTFVLLLEQQLQKLNLSIREAPVVITDGCGVLGPVVEDWLKLALHGVDR